MQDILKQYYGGKTVLVTGGAGAVGSNLVRVLADLGVKKSIIIDNLSSGVEKNIEGVASSEFINGDITNPEVLKYVFSNNIDYVIHLAAFFANQNSVDHPVKDAHINILGTIQLLEHSHSNNVKLFLYANTSCMYSSETTNWREESKELRHDTPYSISKFTGEQYTKFYYKHYQLPAVSVRIFNTFGPYEYPGKYRNVIPNFFHLAMQGKSLNITGTGKETRSFTYVEDTVRGLLLAGAHYDGTWQIYNIGSTQETRIIDLAEKINKITGNTAPIVFSERRDWDKSLRRRPDITRAEKRLGYKPTVLLDEGLQRTHQWFTETVLP